MPRLFVGVDLPDAVDAALAGLCRGVEGARWERPEKLHVTLAFLGEVADPTPVREALASVCAPSFRLTVRSVGFFGRRRAARILWAGLDPSAPLAALKAAVDAALVPLGFEPEARPFHAHVTLARFKRPPGPDLDEWVSRHAAFSAGPFPVEDFRLYASRLTPRGSFYDVLEAFKLG